ncbi:hypothetical protein RCL1_002138 [Eukaryota sp. TZLM3-RCL]
MNTSLFLNNLKQSIRFSQTKSFNELRNFTESLKLEGCFIDSVHSSSFASSLAAKNKDSTSAGFLLYSLVQTLYNLFSSSDTPFLYRSETVTALLPYADTFWTEVDDINKLRLCSALGNLSFSVKFYNDASIWYFRLYTCYNSIQKDCRFAALNNCLKALVFAKEYATCLQLISILETEEFDQIQEIKFIKFLLNVLTRDYCSAKQSFSELSTGRDCCLRQWFVSPILLDDFFTELVNCMRCTDTFVIDCLLEELGV